jgi:hypothetical protein
LGHADINVKPTGRAAPTAPRLGISETEWHVLDLLLEHRDRTWGIGELVDEIGSPIAVAEALQALQAAGLAESSSAFVFITRAAPA